MSYSHHSKVTTRRYRVLTFAKCTTIMIAKFAVTSGLGSSFDKMVWFGWEWIGFGLACVEPYDLQNPFVDHS
jgi:hypothetical protein